MGKSLLESRTFWLATAQAIVGVLTVFMTAYPTVGELLVVKSIADVVLRLLTEEPII